MSHTIADRDGTPLVVGQEVRMLGHAEGAPLSGGSVAEVVGLGRTRVHVHFPTYDYRDIPGRARLRYHAVVPGDVRVIPWQVEVQAPVHQIGDQS